MGGRLTRLSFWRALLAMSDFSSSSLTTVTTFVALGLASAVAISEFWPASDADAATPVAATLSEADFDRLEKRVVDALEDRLAAQLGPGVTAAADGRTDSQVLTQEAIADALRSLIKDQPSVLEGLAGAEELVDSLESEGEESLESLIAELDELGVSMDPENADSRELWERIHNAGLTDEVLAHYAALAEAAPNDPVAQLDSARAFLAAAMRDPQGADQAWWGVSDEAYARTLSLDPNHWDARMEKAVTLTFWPDMFGRKSEAISHFETLIQQAELLPADSQHADAYLLLGNLLDQQGDSDRAQEIWNRGIARHPEDGGLRDRLGR